MLRHAPGWLAIVLSAGTLVVGCGDDDGERAAGTGTAAAARETIVVSAAASLTEALTACQDEVKGVDPKLSFAGSDELAAQIRQGVKPDVYLAANTKLPAELREEGLLRPAADGGHVSVKEAVLPFNRFPDVDTVLGPEMRSTGEVMGIDSTFGLAFAKSQIAAGDRLPESGSVFFSLADRDKETGVAAASRFVELGFSLAATAGTAAHLEGHGVPVETVVGKLGEGPPDGDSNGGSDADPYGGMTAVDLIASGKVQLVVNTPRGMGSRADGAYIRSAASVHKIPCLTTVAAARAAAAGIADWGRHQLHVRSLQEYLERSQLQLPL